MHRIFQHDPTAFARAFHALQLPFAEPIAVEQVSVDLTETEPVERRADTILRITTAEDTYLWREHMATDLSFFRSESAQRLRAQGRAEGLGAGHPGGHPAAHQQGFERVSS